MFVVRTFDKSKDRLDLFLGEDNLVVVDTGCGTFSFTVKAWRKFAEEVDALLEEAGL